MDNTRTTNLIMIALAAVLLGFPAGLLAQEEDDAPPAETPVAAGPKLTIELGAPFRDDAVLQREMKVPVWGWSKPGTVVTVEFAGQKKSTTAGKDGKWLVELDPLRASFEPAQMVITESTGKTITLKNILVGEVWFASGQSNMQWVASKCDVAQLQKQIAGRVAAGKEKQPVIREAKINNYYAALHPVEHANAAWHAEAGDMSAIAYSFAYHVFREVDVPVGILNCSFSQTSIQAWTPRVGFRDGKDEYTQAIYREVLQTDPNTPEHKAAWEKYYAEVESALKAGQEIPTKVPGNMSGNRDATWLFNARLNPMIPYAVRGGIWNQGYANMGEGLVYYNNLHSMIRGWRLMWNRAELPVYFNQFYCPGNKGTWDNTPEIGGTAEMRLGTWLARDIPHTGMASQIDIQGAIHYSNKTLSGQRLALHALKNEYGKKVVADGPMFKSYRVDGDKVIVELENAAGGLVVAETSSNSKDGLAAPKIVPDGARQVKLLYVADENRVWFPAAVQIDGDKVIVSSPKVKAPRGVSYGTGGVGNQPNLYNQALVPLTPFIYYDHKLVTKETWPGGVLKVDGVEIDPSTLGKVYEYRKMPLLSSQFLNNAVLQAGQPVTIWGSAIHDWGYEAKGEAVIKFSLAGIEKTIPVTSGMREWQVTLPPMAASAEPKTLKVTFTIDGELVHERAYTNILFGDVWYVAAPAGEKEKKDLTGDKTSGLVRMMTRHAKGDRSNRPRRFSVSTSTTPDNRYASFWENADGFAVALGQRIAAKTGKPVGIIFMQSAAGKGSDEPELKHWIAAECLDRAPSLMPDYEQLAGMRPGSKYYAANVQRYVTAWKKYWGEYVPALIETKAVPDGAPWGRFPNMREVVKTDAAEVYNVMVSSFTPASFKGIVFLTGKQMVAADQGAHFGEQMSALANCWKDKFACEDPQFIYTMPGKALAPKITAPKDIKGKSTACEIEEWTDAKSGAAQAQKLIEKIVAEAYR